MRLSSAEFAALQARTAKHNPAPVSRAVEEEGELHEQIKTVCQARRWAYVHARMDKPATHDVLGVPDFIIALPDGRTLWVECKARGKKLRPEQSEFAYHLKSLGHAFWAVQSLEQFMGVIPE